MPDIETRLAILEREVVSLGSYFDRIDKFSEKTADAVSAIKEMLIVHEERIRVHTAEITAHAASDDVQFREINRKLDDAKTNLTTQMSDAKTDLTAQMGDLETKVLAAIDPIAKKVGKLEMVRWVLMGAGFVVAAIAGHFGFQIPWP